MKNKNFNVNGYSKLLISFGLSILIFITSGFFGTVSAQTTKVIYFLSGPKDHVGPAGTGRHETGRDLLVLRNCLDSVANLKGLNIKSKN